MKARFLATLLLGSILSSPAWAGLTTTELTDAQEILNQFNLVDFGTYNANNETEGPVAIGGTFNGQNHNIGFNNGAANPVVGSTTYGTVNAFGTVAGGFDPYGTTYIAQGTSGSPTIDVQGSQAPVNFAGSGSATIQTNGTVNTTQTQAGSTLTIQNASSKNYGLAYTSVFPFASSASNASAAFQAQFQNPLTDLAAGLATLASNGAVTAQQLTQGSSGTSFTANADYTANGLSYGVITTTYANLAAEPSGWNGINNNGNAATIVLVTGNPGTNTTLSMPTLNGNANESDVIFDFVNAQSVLFSGQFFGTVLAPDATITNNGNLTGSIVAANLTQNSELHWTSGAPANSSNYGFGGNLSGLSGLIVSGSSTVPEPATITVMAAGLAGLGAIRRFRRNRRRS